MLDGCESLSRAKSKQLKDYFRRLLYQNSIYEPLERERINVFAYYGRHEFFDQGEVLRDRFGRGTLQRIGWR